MSKSRLEKFLYALYSLDSSDLPNPLSRIEELYKCLVTGDEAPTFEPISRVEKYLMAILGGYDVELLPNPLSRVEVLLYKLATGDDSLEDFDTFLSEHEELLAEIIRNGGAGGNINIEYVLYTLSTEFNTLYNTAEKPVKSAILKGETLVNILSESNAKITNSSTYNINYTHNLDTTKTYILRYRINQIPELSDVTDSGRLLKFEWYNGIIINGYIDIYNKDIIVGTNNFIIINPFSAEVKRTKFGVWCPNYVSGNLDMDIMLMEYQEGMENWDIPYFEGMKSVKMPVLTTTGKNLFEPSFIPYNGSEYNDFKKAFATSIKPILRLKPNTTYYIHGEIVQVPNHNTAFKFVDGDGVEIQGTYVSMNNTNGSDYKKITINNKFTTKTDGNVYFNTFPAYSQEDLDKLKSSFLTSQIQIEEGSTLTTYEPYKSNILTVNEEVELRGIGGVKDTLDLMTGEVEQSIYHLQLTGDERWGQSGYTNDDYLVVYTMFTNNLTIPSSKVICDKLNYDSSVGITTAQKEGINIIGDCSLRISLSKTKVATLNDFINWVRQEQPVVNFVAKEKSIKTVDLSVVNQDENDTKLSTFNDITHVTISSEGLIPEAELEVATKNEEDLEDSIVYTTHILSEEFNTLYNTAKKPVKSAILKGQTLVNHVFKFERIMAIGTGNYRVIHNKTLSKPLNPNTNYLFINHSNVGYTLNVSIAGETTSEKSVIIGLKTSMCKFTTPDNTEDFTRMMVYLMAANESELTYNTFMIIEYQEGMENWDIPYFEGMQSVKMPVLTTTGKNLFDKEKHKLNPNFGAPQTYYGTDYIKVNQLTTYTRNNQTSLTFHTNHGGTTSLSSTSSTTFTTTAETNYIRYNVLKTEIDTHQLEEGSVATPYEPYKSNILTVNEEVELRGIGEVKDELDLITGKLIQRTIQLPLNSNYFNFYRVNNADQTNTIRWQLVFKDDFIANSIKVGSNGKCNIIDYYKGGGADKECIFIHPSAFPNRLQIKQLRTDTRFTTSEELELFLLENQAYIVLELATESIKTVDLSVVDQDGDNTKLSTFNDITHVTLSSEGLIPEAELEVAEKVPEVAASMLTISREQEVIDTTTNEQSENVDATMIATTEIYEGLL